MFARLGIAYQPGAAPELIKRGFELHARGGEGGGGGIMMASARCSWTGSIRWCVFMSFFYEMQVKATWLNVAWEHLQWALPE